MSFTISAITAAGYTNNASKGKQPEGYTVKSGETVNKIAAKFNMTTEDFKKYAGLKSDNIRAGQVLKVPTHTLGKGQTLTSVAKKYGMTVKQLCILNNIKEKDAGKVNAGTVLFVYGSKSAKVTPQKNSPKEVNNTKPAVQSKSAEKPKSSPAKSEATLEMPSRGYLSRKDTDVSMVRTSGAGKSQPPKPVDKDGNVVAEVIAFFPSHKGDLTGKTIMINAGHGWGASNFKPGTQHKDSNGKMLQEWYKNRDIAEDVIKEFCNRGATVIYTTGDAPEVCKARNRYKHDLLISIHCNAAENRAASGLKVMYNADDGESARLMDCVQDNFKKNLNNNTAGMSDKDGQHQRIGILHGKRPSVMVELGFMSNSTDIKNIDSKAWQQKAATQLADAVETFFGK